MHTGDESEALVMCSVVQATFKKYLEDTMYKIVSWRYFLEDTFILFTNCTNHVERKLGLCFKPAMHISLASCMYFVFVDSLYYWMTCAPVLLSFIICNLSIPYIVRCMWTRFCELKTIMYMWKYLQNQKSIFFFNKILFKSILKWQDTR